MKTVKYTKHHRVGGAHLADMVAAASDINLWKEWAAMISKEKKYTLPKVKKRICWNCIDSI
jgi:hypothetical protein